MSNLTVGHRLEDNVEECVDGQAFCPSLSFQSASVNNQHSSITGGNVSPLVVVKSEGSASMAVQR